MAALRKALHPDTELLGVTVLTSLTERETSIIYSCSTMQAVIKLGILAHQASIDGLICSGAEAQALKKKFAGMSINTPAIRPSWSIVDGDDQNPERIMTPAKALRAGADLLVVGRPITRHENPREAAIRTLEEMENFYRKET